ncbi:hypothetical protein CDAR_191641 [Caerostris darwini]|uniref:Uncharacterized protein n=1 Tax=Caerostris darwini TaxID=1538125 RepID=A0AAV4W6B2_9ARAC|nr:hypothetical protein CDAR_191641 [Caerostris darwini]
MSDHNSDLYKLSNSIESVGGRGCRSGVSKRGREQTVLIYLCRSSSVPMVACCMLWIGFVVHRTLPVAICDASIVALSLDPNSSLQESSSGGLPCSADFAADRQTSEILG